MRMSNSYDGGTEIYTRFSTPVQKQDVKDIVQQFVRQNFTNSAETIDKISETDGFFVIEADPSENISPVTLENERDDTLRYYGAFISPATNHSIQQIWEYQYEIRENSGGKVYVRVSSWKGTSLEKWNERVKTNSMY